MRCCLHHAGGLQGVIKWSRCNNIPPLTLVTAVAHLQGLNKIDMVTMVTGSHAIGGFRHLSSPGLTDCPYVPFDCPPAGQTSAAPFDNNVFKVACNGVADISMGVCEWNTKCSNPSVDETANGCPFTGAARARFAACNATSYPTPGLISGKFSASTWILLLVGAQAGPWESDCISRETGRLVSRMQGLCALIHADILLAVAVMCGLTSTCRCVCPADIYLCNQASTRQRMIQYARDQDFFFKAYADGFDKLGALGYKEKDLSVL